MYTDIILIKNNPGSIFISFACWKTIIGKDIKIIAAKVGRWMKFFFLFDEKISENITHKTITDRNPPILFIKNAWTGLSKRYPIPVNVCQLIIDHKKPTSQDAAIKRGKFIYAHKSSQPIGKGRIIEIKLIDNNRVINIKNISAVISEVFIFSNTFLLHTWFSKVILYVKNDSIICNNSL